MAVARIFEAKKRPHFDPLIVHCHSIEQVETLVTDMPEKAIALARTFWPGALTLILPRKSIIPDIVTSGHDSAGIRIPNHSLAISLLQQLEFPLAAPSANPFGYISPTTASHVEDQLKDEVDYILDGGACRIGIESTIVSFVQPEPEILRLGGISTSGIEKIIGRVKVNVAVNSNPQAPGLLDSHYAPRIPLKLVDIREALKKETDIARVGVLSLQTRFDEVPAENQEILSATGDLHEAACNLFAAMRRLDTKDLDIILAERMPLSGLGPAMNDRLYRASQK